MVKASYSYRACYKQVILLYTWRRILIILEISQDISQILAYLKDIDVGNSNLESGIIIGGRSVQPRHIPQ